MKFKDILQKEMNALDMNKGQTAKLLGVSKVTLNSYLSGITSPPFDQAVTMVSDMNKEVLIIDRYES